MSDGPASGAAACFAAARFARRSAVLSVDVIDALVLAELPAPAGVAVELCPNTGSLNVAATATHTTIATQIPSLRTIPSPFILDLVEICRKDTTRSDAGGASRVSIFVSKTNPGQEAAQTQRTLNGNRSRLLYECINTYQTVCITML